MASMPLGGARPPCSSAGGVAQGTGVTGQRLVGRSGADPVDGLVGGCVRSPTRDRFSENRGGDDRGPARAHQRLEDRSELPIGDDLVDHAGVEHHDWLAHPSTAGAEMGGALRRPIRASAVMGSTSSSSWRSASSDSPVVPFELLHEARRRGTRTNPWVRQPVVPARSPRPPGHGHLLRWHHVMLSRPTGVSLVIAFG